ncbi:MAG: MurR/RpiR family transcriptional regulator [Mycoplasmatales bacterium]|nr:MurR/RpiR family transcriptional regulator [Mycoplasmatales bacterium]
MLIDRIRFHKANFTKSDRKISKWLIEEKNNQLPTNIIKASKLIGVSSSAITRFCQKIKLEGWNELLFHIKEENKSNKTSNPEETLNNIIYSLSRTERQMNMNTVRVIAKKIREAKYVFLYGESFTEVLATQFSRKLNKIGITTKIFNVASDIAVIMPKEEAVHILISMSGMNPNIKKAVKKIKHLGQVKQNIYSIGSTKYSNIIDFIDEFIGGTFYQESPMDPYELPYIATYSITYIMDKIFEEIYKADSKTYEKRINEIAKEKKR